MKVSDQLIQDIIKIDPYFDIDKLQNTIKVINHIEQETKQLEDEIFQLKNLIKRLKAKQVRKAPSFDDIMLGHGP